MDVQRLSRSHRRRIFGGYNRKVMAYGPIAYWPLWETAGSVAECLVNPAQNGAYVGTTLGQTGIGDGKTCPFFDGINDYVSAISDPLAAAFKPAVGTISFWAKVYNAGAWIDGQSRAFLYTHYDASNFVMLKKDNDNNKVLFYYKAGTSKYVEITPYSETGWFFGTFTWSAAADEIKGYIDGVQQGNTVTSLGTWDPANSISRFLIGSYNTTPIQLWYGWLAHVAVWDRVLSPAAVLDLSTV